jgi:hypothetical protein
VVPGQDPVLPKDDRTVAKYFNTAAWVVQPAGTLGNAPRTFMHGPPQRRLDLAIFKQVGLGGQHSLQLRYEIYNLTNTDEMYQRFPGLEGSIYYVAGFGVNYQQIPKGRIVLAPIRTGVGFRAGVNAGYLSYTKFRSWIPL